MFLLHQGAKLPLRNSDFMAHVSFFEYASELSEKIQIIFRSLKKPLQVSAFGSKKVKWTVKKLNLIEISSISNTL